MEFLKSKFIATALVASISTYTLANDRGDRIIDRLDTDGDNLISLEEFRFPSGRGNMLLNKADLNDDGEITLDEALEASSQRMAERQKKMQTKLTAMDTNADGVITAEEIRAHAFNRIDQDNDGFLSAEEFRRGKHHQRKPHRRHGNRHDAPDSTPG